MARLLVKSTPLAMLLFVCSAVCAQPGAVGISRSESSWSTKADGEEIKGIHHASITRATLHTGSQDVSFVLWSDMTGTSGGGGGSFKEVYYKGAHGGGQKKVEFEIEPSDDPTEIRIGDKNYTLAEGNVFLVSTHSMPAKVKQLKLDPKKLPGGYEKLIKYATAHREIAAFFADDQSAE